MKEYPRGGRAGVRLFVMQREVVNVANEKNLKPVRTKREARERGKKGGQKSGEVRREKRLLRDCMTELLDLPVNDTERRNKLSRMGIDPERIDNRALLTVSLFMRAVEFGDVAAFKEIRDLIGENVSEANNSKLDELIEGFNKL